MIRDVTTHNKGNIIWCDSFIRTSFVSNLNIADYICTDEQSSLYEMLKQRLWGVIINDSLLISSYSTNELKWWECMIAIAFSQNCQLSAWSVVGNNYVLLSGSTVKLCSSF